MCRLWHNICMPTFKIVSFGCRTNQYESQSLHEQLCALGWRPASRGEASELAIVNACAVTASAEKRVRQMVKALLKDGQLKRIIITGCGIQKNLDGLSDPRMEVIADKKKLRSSFGGDVEAGISYFYGHSRAFVKVQDGCNNFCSYCIIPHLRGRSVSRPFSEIIDEAERLSENGYPEVVLTGIHVGDYAFENKDLSDLIAAVGKIFGIKRIRLGSMGPDQMSEKLMGAMLESEKFCLHLHLALQSGSDAVLGRMRRRYTRSEFLDKVLFLRRERSDFVFTTDVIVGFPGETEEDFLATLDMMGKVGFAHTHMFPYSERAGTPAAAYANKVPSNVIADRKTRLMQLSSELAFAARETFVGREGELLLENESEGHSRHFILAKGMNKLGERRALVKVKFLKNTKEGFLACRL